MSGLRIHYTGEPRLSNCTLRIPHPGEIRRGLRRINKGRKAKDYHIRLDDEGNCIVSETVWKRLQEVNAPFIILNEVRNPPAITIGMQEGEFDVPAEFRYLDGIAQEFAPPGVRTFIARRKDG